MRICDICKKPIPLGTNDHIEVHFCGRFGELIKIIHGVSHLDFCSLKCFSEFKVPTVNADCPKEI